MGSSCLAEKRMLEKLGHGEIKTPFMKVGDRVRIEMKNLDGTSIFGAIDQQVAQAEPRPGGQVYILTFAHLLRVTLNKCAQVRMYTGVSIRSGKMPIFHMT